MPWLTVPNITPDKETGAGTWTEWRVPARAIREAASDTMSQRRPVMPYQKFAAMWDKDLASIVVYLAHWLRFSRAAEAKIPFPPGPLIDGLPHNPNLRA